MKIIRELTPAPADTAVALGFFDGIHLGHRAVISGAVREKINGLAPTVLTFTESPLRELTGAGAPRLLEEGDREAQLSGQGVELLYLLPFTGLMELTPERFVEEVLVNTLRAKRVFCGFNYRFGRGGRADAKRLIELCRPFGVQVTVLEPVILDDAPVSSTRIRNMIEVGDVRTAARLLGRPFSFDFEVVHGRQVGRLMGTPTLNQPFPEGFVLPKFGVYASLVRFDQVLTYGVTNVGVKPTVGADGPLAETWMPAYTGGELYGKKVCTSLMEFLRSEKKFADLDALRAAILADGKKAEAICRPLLTHLHGKP